MKILNTLLVAVIAVIYYLRARLLVDPDFGWSIRIGEIISTAGIPKQDPFSYTMPGYFFIDHEWLTHQLMAKIYATFGYPFLAAIFTLLALVAILFTVRRVDVRFMLFQLLFIAAGFYSYFGIRPQVISWFFFALVATVLLEESLWRRYRYLFPLIFLVWVNLHGGFVMGMILTAFLFFFKKNNLDRILMLLSLLTLFVNPYGLNLVKEIWLSLSDASIRLYINEWRPIIFGITSTTLIFLAFSSAFVFHYWKKYTWKEKILYLLFLAAAFSSVRNLPFFIILAVLLMNKGIKQFIDEIGTDKKRLRRFYIFYSVVLVITLSLSVWQMSLDYAAAKYLSEDAYYPRQAVRYLTDHLPKGQILSAYEWGGYLIWKLPQKKVFIDGRMASWKQKPRPLESSNALAEHLALLELRIPSSRVFAKYGIDTVLLPQSWLVKKDKITYAVAVKFLAALEKNNFHKVYQDRVAMIYSKRTPLSIADN